MKLGREKQSGRQRWRKTRLGVRKGAGQGRNYGGLCFCAVERGLQQRRHRFHTRLLKHVGVVSWNAMKVDAGGEIIPSHLEIKIRTLRPLAGLQKRDLSAIRLGLVLAECGMDDGVGVAKVVGVAFAVGGQSPSGALDLAPGLVETVSADRTRSRAASMRKRLERWYSDARGVAAVLKGIPVVSVIVRVEHSQQGNSSRLAHELLRHLIGDDCIHTEACDVIRAARLHFAHGFTGRQRCLPDGRAWPGDAVGIGQIDAEKGRSVPVLRQQPEARPAPHPE